MAPPQHRRRLHDCCRPPISTNTVKNKSTIAVIFGKDGAIRAYSPRPGCKKLFSNLKPPAQNRRGFCCHRKVWFWCSLMDSNPRKGVGGKQKFSPGGKKRQFARGRKKRGNEMREERTGVVFWESGFYGGTTGSRDEAASVTWR